MIQYFYIAFPLVPTRVSQVARRGFSLGDYLVPFSTYSTGVPRDPRQSKMRRQEIACHRLGSQWRHSTTHESVSIVKTKTDIIETQQRATWLQKPPKKSES